MAYGVANSTLFSIDLNTCDTTHLSPLFDRPLLNITWHPNGKLYGKTISDKELYEINIETGETTLVATLLEEDLITSDLTVGPDGRVYLFFNDGYVSYDPITDVVSTGSFGEELGPNGMTQFKGQLLFANFLGIFRMDLGEFPTATMIYPWFLFEQGSTVVNLFTIVSCDGPTLYGIFQTLENVQSIHEIDLDNQTSTPLCEFDGFLVGSLASRSEFLPPPCQLTIDLDADNSSGASELNYHADTTCLIQNVGICDNDLEIRLDNGQVDSICIFVTNGSSFPFDVLKIESTNHLVVSGENTLQLKLVNDGSASELDFMMALQAVQLSSNENIPPSGTRKIGVIAWSAELRSDTAFAYIPVFSLTPFAGMDADLTLCTAADPLALFPLLGQQATPNGTWQPMLSSFEGIFNPAIHPEGIYHYIQVGVKDCPADTAQIRIIIEEVVMEEEVVHICEGETYLFENMLLSRDTNICRMIPLANGCNATACLRLVVDPMPTVDAGEDQEIRAGEEAFINVSTNVVDLRLVTWTPADYLDCNTCLNVVATPKENINYTVMITAENGCTAMDDIMINLFQDKQVFFPNVFTPNGDDINDRFTAFGPSNELEVLQLRIFNRWGAIVFEASNFIPGDLTGQWNGQFRGQPAPSGVFIFQAKIKWSDGTVESKTGNVTLVR